ncbi:Poly(A) RNA polymerase cid14 [Pseudocercospora fuligena]|uniref:polynucleotide adenylyltransferase n=1 Tax=Pseudocercospora fuligena TaxID=685502 RepID=A0A8H6VMM1_9PEZI|nr:Poly(A) RNA polymerase cid14 [Pseudocercospora fuligena]
MGDSYRPNAKRRRGGHDFRDDRDDRYPPPDRYARDYSPPRNYNDNYDTYPRAESGYSFRGAADNTRPPQRADFSFRAPGDSSAPSFPNAQPPPRAPASRPPPKGPKRGGNDRPKNANNRGGYRKFVPKPAHQRAILQYTDRETTPEQLVGMNSDSQPKFAEVISSDEEDSDDASDAEAGEDGPSRKRAKADEQGSEPVRPKWSNPDPYSVAPPTDLGLQPKKDIVQSIRKAKVEAAQKASSTNAIKENADFISFDMDDDKDDDDSSEGNDDDLVGAPLDDIPPPPPPDDLIMPTDQELMSNFVGGNNKRKRGAEQQQRFFAGHIVDDWLTSDSDPTPWAPTSGYDFAANVGLHLHREILDFMDYVSPRDYEQNCREDLVNRIDYFVSGFRAGGSQIRVQPFGSYASGLYLPDADMDLVATSNEYMRNGTKVFCQNQKQMYRLSGEIRKTGMAKNNNVVTLVRTRVPIIKFVDSRTNIKVDISFENDSGLNTIPTLLAWKQQFPEMPVLVAIIKQFLAMRGLNEVHTGGIGGFTIICLVVSMLQLKPDLQARSQPSYGELLLDFFDLYGNKFDIKTTGIKMKPPGYFTKTKNMGIKINMDRLTIIDPDKPENDISGGSAKIDQVLQCFRGAFSMIQHELDQLRKGSGNSTRSVLGCILGGNYSSFEDLRDDLHALNQQVSRPPRSPTPSPTPAFIPPPAKTAAPPKRLVAPRAADLDPVFERPLAFRKGPPAPVSKKKLTVNIPRGDLAQGLCSTAPMSATPASGDEMED